MRLRRNREPTEEMSQKISTHFECCESFIVPVQNKSEGQYQVVLM